MSEVEPTYYGEDLEDRLQELLEDGGDTMRAFLSRVDLTNYDEYRGAVIFCEEHVRGREDRDIYVVTPPRMVAVPLDQVKVLVMKAISGVGVADGDLYIFTKALE